MAGEAHLPGRRQRQAPRMEAVSVTASVWISGLLEAFGREAFRRVGLRVEEDGCEGLLRLRGREQTLPKTYFRRNASSPRFGTAGG